jgi:hypothetical protein
MFEWQFASISYLKLPQLNKFIIGNCHQMNFLFKIYGSCIFNALFMGFELCEEFSFTNGMQFYIWSFTSNRQSIVLLKE